MPTVIVQAPRSSTAVWLIAVSLLVIAACLVLRLDSPPGGTAMAQPTSLAGARGVFAFTGQLSKGSYGVFMVDVDAGTIWCYECRPDKPDLRLVAGRSWVFDRYLEDFNSNNPSPEQIEAEVEQRRERKLQSQAGAMP